MKLGLDCDDTLLDFIEHLPAVYNQRHGTAYKIADLSPDFADFQCVLGKEGYRKLEDLFHDESYVLSIPPVPGAVEGVRTLSSLGIELYVVTHRQGASEQITLASLIQQFGDVFKEVIFAHGKPKGEICRAGGIDLFVDDLPRNVASINKEGLPALLYDRHWNQDVLEHVLLKRVTTWKEVVKEARKHQKRIEW